MQLSLIFDLTGQYVDYAAVPEVTLLPFITDKNLVV